jgi:hypothetical protein
MNGKIKFKGVGKVYDFRALGNSDEVIGAVSFSAKYNNRPDVIARTFQCLLEELQTKMKTGHVKEIVGSERDIVRDTELLLNSEPDAWVYKTLVEIVKDGYDVIGQEDIPDDFWVGACKHLGYNRDIKPEEARLKFFDIVCPT